MAWRSVQRRSSWWQITPMTSALTLPDNKRLDKVHNSKYLGAIVSDEGSKPQVLSRIAQTTAAVTKLKVIWNDKNIAIDSKIRLMCSLVRSIFLYASETWILTTDIERSIQAMEMRCFRKLLGISYRDHITNKEVKTRTENATGLYEDLLTSVKRQTEAVRACHIIIWTGRDYPTGNSSKRETKRQALICGIFWSSLPGVFSRCSSFLLSFISQWFQPTK